MSLQSLGKENDRDTALFEPLLCGTHRAKCLTDVLVFGTTNLGRRTPAPRVHLCGDASIKSGTEVPRGSPGGSGRGSLHAHG